MILKILLSATSATSAGAAYYTLPIFASETSDESINNKKVPIIPHLYFKHDKNKMFVIAKISNSTNDWISTIKDITDEREYSCIYDDSKNGKDLKRKMNDNKNLFDCKIYSLNSYKNDINVEINELVHKRSKNYTNSTTHLKNSREMFFVLEFDKNEKNLEYINKFKTNSFSSRISIFNKPIYNNPQRKADFYKNPYERFFLSAIVISDPFETNEKNLLVSQYFLIKKQANEKLLDYNPESSKHECIIKSDTSKFDCEIISFDFQLQDKISEDENKRIVFSDEKERHQDNVMKNLRFIDHDASNDSWFIMKILSNKKSNIDLLWKDIEVKFNLHNTKKDFKVYDMMLGRFWITKNERSQKDQIDPEASYFFIPK